MVRNLVEQMALGALRGPSGAIMVAIGIKSWGQDALNYSKAVKIRQ